MICQLQGFIIVKNLIWQFVAGDYLEGIGYGVDCVAPCHSLNAPSSFIGVKNVISSSAFVMVDSDISSLLSCCTAGGTSKRNGPLL